ncbi:hypothetical protein JA9_002734 [Meyerozyma sp. JA9]|nr:hypothetical protein JA9_002734 [Meyerozyma sp. JA9]
MSSLPALESIVRSIECIQAWSGSPSDFGTQVYDVMLRLVRLVNYNEEGQIELKFSVNRQQHVLSDFFVLYTPSGNRNPSSKIDLVDQIKNYKYEHVDNHTQSLVQLLNEVDSDRSDIVASLENLFEFFAHIHRSAEDALVDYLARCVDYEIQHASIMRSNAGLVLEEDVTEQLIEKLDSVGDIVRPFAENHRGNAIHTVVPPSLDLRSNDSVLLEYYQLFLEILTYKYEGGRGTVRDYKRYIHIMVNLYMRSRAVGSLELDTFEVKEEKVNFLYDFMSQEIVKTTDRLLVRAAHQAFNDLKLLRRQEPPVNRTPASIQNSADDFALSESERVAIISHVREFIPDLNDFNFSFNPNFSALLHKYFDLVFVEMEDRVSTGDRQFISSLKRSIDEIARFNYGDDLVDIKSAVMQFYHLHSQLIESQSTFLMRAAYMMFTRCFSTLRFHFKLWHLKTLKFAHDRHILQEKWKSNTRLRNKYLAVWIGRTRQRQDVMAVASSYSASSLESLTFHKWQNKLQLSNNTCLKADKFAAKKFFGSWNSKFNVTKEQLRIARAHHRKIAYKPVLKVLVEKKAAIDTSIALADTFHSETKAKVHALLLKITFDLWVLRVNEAFSNNASSVFDHTEEASRSIESTTMSSKLKHLLTTEKQFVLSKFMRKIVLKHQLNKILQSVYIKNSKHILRVFFQLWKKVRIMNEALNSYNARRCRSLKREFWNLWTGELAVKSAQLTFRRERLLKWAFSTWKANLASKQKDQASLKRPVLTVFLQKWKLSFQLTLWTKEKDHAQMKNFFSALRRKQAQTVDNSESALQLHDEVLRKKAFKTWKTKNIAVRERLQDSDSFVLRKFTSKWLSQYSRIQDMSSLETKLGPISDRLITKLYLKLWVQKQEEKYSLYIDEKVKFFERRLQGPLFVSRFFRHWVDQLLIRKNQEMEMEQRCIFFERHSYTLKAYLHHWRESALAIEELEGDAVEFESRMLTKKALVIWYERYASNMQLIDLSNDFRDQREFSKSREVLNVWSMKVLKYVKRNQQSCALFIEKWDQARKRDFFDLWRSNLLASRNVRDEDGDTTMSNQSPLANKSTRNLTGSPSYLNTPLKKSPPRDLNTFSSSRLESTTLRVKSQRISALKRRFESAKNSSERDARESRRVSESYQQNYVRLSPPKVRNSYRSISPPEPPNFDIKRTNTPAGPNPMDEMSIIATAKKLRRITPIFIPTEDDEGTRERSSENNVIF